MDARTGYRYYTPDLERRARLIRRMREVGVPVETMRVVLDAPPERAAEVLQELAERAAETAQLTASVVAEVVSTLQQGGQAADPVAVPINGPELGTALRRVARAASSEAGSPLHGVLVDITGSVVTVAATDRYWLATWSLISPRTQPDRRRVVVALDDVESLAGWLHRHDTVTVSLAADSALISVGGQDRAIVQAEDRFPAYRLLVDGQPAPRGRATLTRTDLLDASLDGPEAVRLLLGPDRVTVAHGHSEESNLLATTTGGPIALAFSPTLLVPPLRMLAGPEVSLSYAAPDQPVRISSPDQPHVQALVMPQRGPA